MSQQAPNERKSRILLRKELSIYIVLSNLFPNIHQIERKSALLYVVPLFKSVEYDLSLLKTAMWMGLVGTPCSKMHITMPNHLTCNFSPDRELTTWIACPPS